MMTRRFTTGASALGALLLAGTALSPSGARAADGDPKAFVANRELFGDLADHPPFVEAYLAALHALQSGGARVTLEELVGVPA